VVFDSRDRPIMESASDPGRSHAHDRTAADHHQAAHAVRHNPMRALADIEAKRQIVALHSDATGHSCSVTDETGYNLNYGEVSGEEACTTLRLLALPYADHPGYRGEWRP
jgi:hypothetical protein